MPLLEPTPGSQIPGAPSIFYQRALRHGRVVGRYAIVQAFVQLLGFLSGILIVRILTEREYAYVTIANTMQGTMNMLGDIGISAGVISIGGRVWEDRFRFSQVITTALYLRRRLALLAVVVVTPILYFMLARNGATLPYAFCLIAIVLIGLAFQLDLGVLAAVPRLYSEIVLIQRIDLVGAVVRLAVLALLAFVYLNAGVAVAVATGAFLLQVLLLRRYCTRVINFTAPINSDDSRAMVGFVKSQAANVIFFGVQGQITVLLATFLGRQVSSVAAVGALGRLAMIFTILTNLLANVLVPAFARCQDRRRSARLYLEIVFGVLAFCVAVLIACALFPNFILSILGQRYFHLTEELFWMAGTAVASALTATFYSLNAARGWLAGSWLNIPLTLATQVLLIPFTQFGNVKSLLIFTLLSLLPNLLLHLVLSLRGYARWQRPGAA